MTAVLHSQRNARHFSSDSDEYNSTLQYLTDSDTEEYSGNHATPLVDEDVGSLKISPRLSAGTSLPKYRSTKVHEAGAQLSMVALVLATVRKSLLTCQAPEEVDIVEEERERATVDKVKEKEKGKGKEIKMSMDIGWPTDVEHIAHVTFDRYNGFLGLPEEYEHEVPRPTPSARFVFTSDPLCVLLCVCWLFRLLLRSIFSSLCRVQTPSKQARVWATSPVSFLIDLSILIFEKGSRTEIGCMSLACYKILESQ